MMPSQKRNPKKTHKDDYNYQRCIAELSVALQKNVDKFGENNKELQEKQYNALVNYEFEFRKQLIRHPRGMEVYSRFIADSPSILGVRPFFRERSDVFNTTVSPAMKEKNPLPLTRCRINWMFVNFVVNLGWWNEDEQGKDLLKIANQIKSVRNTLLEYNLPFAMHQAKVFAEKNPRSHLDFMDFVQISSIGLCRAFDKYCPPYSSNFGAVMYGLTLGEMIASNSETQCHFYPPEKKALYRLNRIIKNLPDNGEFDYIELHRLLNLSEAEQNVPLTSFSTMVKVLALSHFIPASMLDSTPSGEFFSSNQTGVIDRHPAKEEDRHDVILESKDLWDYTYDHIRLLDLFDKKVLRLKGVEIDFCEIIPFK